MTGKEITDLTVTSLFADNDLILIRKSGQAEDKAIKYQDLLKSIGNTAVSGFIATTEAANKITLNTANGVKIDSYYNGMKISFVSPIANTAAVQVKIGTLGYKDIYIHNTNDANVDLVVNDYVEAVLIGGVFYQTNAIFSFTQSSDYIPYLQIPSSDNSRTDLYIKSAAGAKKRKFYDGMTVKFVPTAQTVGFVKLFIDDLEGKWLIEKGSLDEIISGNPSYIYTPLNADQLVEAVYTTDSGGYFLRNNFEISKPLAELEEVVVGDEVVVVVPEVNVYDYKLSSYNGGLGNFLKQILNEHHKADKTKIKIKILIDRTLTLKHDNNIDSIYIDTDMSFIEFSGVNNIINFNVINQGLGGIGWLSSYKKTYPMGIISLPFFKEDTVINVNLVGLITQFRLFNIDFNENVNLYFKNVTFNINSSTPQTFYDFHLFSFYNINNVTCYFKSCTVLNNCPVSNSLPSYQGGDFLYIRPANSIAGNKVIGNFTLEDCVIKGHCVKDVYNKYYATIQFFDALLYVYFFLKNTQISRVDGLTPSQENITVGFGDNKLVAGSSVSGGVHFRQENSAAYTLIPANTKFKAALSYYVGEFEYVVVGSQD